MDYITAIGKIKPGTFVPDIGGSELDAPIVTPLGGGNPTSPLVSPETGVSFKDTVKGLLGDVNDKLNTSEQNMKDLADGKTNDLGRVATSSEEANLALNFAMAMRTKLLEAYQEIERVQM